MAVARLIFAVIFLVLGGARAVKYKKGDQVVVFANKVGPYYNPHETYHYYQLPLCRPHEVKQKELSLSELLDGDRMAYSDYKINFQESDKLRTLCTLKLTESDVTKLKDAIEDLYFFEFVVDEIPARGFIGHLLEGGIVPHTHELKLYLHHYFYFEFNNDEIIYMNISTSDEEGKQIKLDDVSQFPLVVNFTYSVKWTMSNLQRDERMKKMKESGFFPVTLEIHWLSIINSMILVFLLIGFVVIIMTRILKKDFARYNLEDDDNLDADDDNGWKIIHTDVFRFPAYKSLFCAILGVGCQFLIIATAILMMALLGLFNVHRHGSINAASIILYALTSCISGYVAACMFKKMGGENWVWNINLTSALFAGPFFLVWSVLNTLAWIYGSTQALPWDTILLLGLLWLLLGYPLTIIGGILGKNSAGSFDAPCRTKNIAREIPDIPFYKSTLAHCIVGGFLPFSAISVELYYIFSTLWGREHYTLFGILSIVYIILLSVTACISVALTYFQLSSEDYRWWWRSIISAGSTGAFVFLYSLFYYTRRSNMYGLLQTAEFFGFSVLVCYIFFLMLGTVAFFSSLKFVKFIYVNIKMD
ncbi:hypothetical protein HELRODRAFT_157541 [Helobdella robusta]|uniref:Transmembrane 9 superfamily member n=1 Tax=Helobdella robusta TaxID=6412 RepID=T1EMD0_HELRO|nr:hypothetical protein HELRODRAFT_157541 [Helobdella robusta]ESN97463.1 hypothetical protein HELRODRAFT_157541 [Helobdella robusta]